MEWRRRVDGGADGDARGREEKGGGEGVGGGQVWLAASIGGRDRGGTRVAGRVRAEPRRVGTGSVAVMMGEYTSEAGRERGVNGFVWGSRWVVAWIAGGVTGCSGPVTVTCGGNRVGSAIFR